MFIDQANKNHIRHEGYDKQGIIANMVIQAVGLLDFEDGFVPSFEAEEDAAVLPWKEMKKNLGKIHRNGSLPNRPIQLLRPV